MTTKRLNLREHATKLLALYDGPCTDRRLCAMLEAVLATSNGRRPGLSREPFFSLRKGGMAGVRIVLFVKANEYAELRFCPFCGKPTNTPKQVAIMKAVNSNDLPKREASKVERDDPAE